MILEEKQGTYAECRILADSNSVSLDSFSLIVANRANGFASS